MDWQTLIPSILTGIAGFISGFGLAVLRGVTKIIEDIWHDYRAEKKRVRTRKYEIVSQLLIDIPRAKSNNFEVTYDSKTWNKTLAEIAIYDKDMSTKVGNYLNLWRHHAKSWHQLKGLGEILVDGADDQPTSQGPDYLERIHTELLGSYDSVIDLLNQWKK